MKFENTLSFAKKLDALDPLKNYRNKFLFPKHQSKKAIYFTGNSLGLQPVAVEASLKQELKDWANYGVEGHFEAKNPWFSYLELFATSLSKIVGSKRSEVIVMNQLTSNLHFLFVSF